MTINITGRKTTIKDSFREEAEREMTRFDRLFDDDASAHITVSNEGGRETVEITIRSGGMIFRAEKTTEDRKQSLAQAGDLLFRQIVKNKSKLADRFKKRAPEIYAEPAAEEPDYSVIKRKHFTLKPMHVDEAILQMELLGHNFYMFLNAETEVPNVVYKRNACWSRMKTESNPSEGRQRCLPSFCYARLSVQNRPDSSCPRPSP